MPDQDAATVNDSNSLRFDFIDDEIALMYDDQSVAVGDEIEGVVTFGTDWVDFFFQNSPSAVLYDLQTALNELYDMHNFPSITTTPAFANGCPCVAKYSADNKWYRARLTDINYQLVFFVDYGNRQMTNLANVKPLTRTLAELVPPLAYHCKLAKYQNALLPSFVEENDLIRITIHSKQEPYEVSVQVVTQKSVGSGRPGVTVQTLQQSNLTNEYTNSRHQGERPLKGDGQVMRRLVERQLNLNSSSTTTIDPRSGLTVPIPRPSASRINEEEDEIDKLKIANRRTTTANQPPRVTQVAGKIAVSGARGCIVDLYATCGQIAGDLHYRGYVFDFNSQESTLQNGAIRVNDLCRIFRKHDRVVCNARYDEPYVGRMSTKVSKAPQGYYLVTDMAYDDSSPNPGVLISHAVVTFVSSQGAILYVRNRAESIFAPVSAFGDGAKPMVGKSNMNDRHFLEQVQLGRSVIVRASPVDKFPDLQVTSEWFAQAVELMGEIVEHEGNMYLIRDSYSVIITDGGVGFGYVFAQNEFIDCAGVAQDQWFGCRVLFRACLDVPDRENFRFGDRWKALSVRILPERERGAYRYPGIFRPSSYGESSSSASGQVASTGKKISDDDITSENDNFDLPDEALQEMRLMGKDVVGVKQLTSFINSTRFTRLEVVENVLNEPEDVSIVHPTSPVDASTAMSHSTVSQVPSTAFNSMEHTTDSLLSADELPPTSLLKPLPEPIRPISASTHHDVSSCSLKSESDRFPDNASKTFEFHSLSQALMGCHPPLHPHRNSDFDDLCFMDSFGQVPTIVPQNVIARKSAGSQTDAEISAQCELRELRKQPELFQQTINYVLSLPIAKQQRFFELLESITDN